MVKVLCKNCRKDFSVKPSDLQRGRGIFCSKSCAASGKNNAAYKHGNSTRKAGQTKEYRTWAGIKQRVQGHSAHQDKYYRARGIKMSRRWFNSFEEFYKDMGEAPSPKHEIDRIDVNGHYVPSNCRWVTKSQQMNNTTQNKRLTFNGRTLNQAQWTKELGFPNDNVIHKRLMRGWSLEKTLTTPLLSDWQVNDWRN